MQAKPAIFRVDGMVAVPSGTVTENDITRADEAAQPSPLGLRKRIVASNLVHYEIDECKVTDPLDTSAKRLTAVWEFTLKDDGQPQSQDVIESDRSCSTSVVMSEQVRYLPWVGAKYESGNRFGVRVLILGESHHGSAEDLHREVTSSVVKEWGQEKRRSFFTTVSKFICSMGKGTWISNADRAEAWEHVAFYNFVQESAGPASRYRPTRLMWERAAAPLQEVLAVLKPDVLVVLGVELNSHLPASLPDIEVVRLIHPTAGFEYAYCNPKLQTAVENAKSRKIFDTVQAV